MQFDPMEPLALLPATIPTLVGIIKGEIGKGTLPATVLHSGESLEELAAAQASTTGNMIAVVPVWGVLSPDGNYGGTSLDGLGRVVTQLDANPNISAIVLNVNSPGGTVVGTQEASDAIRRVRDNGSTRIVAHANGMMASAAMWVGAAASEVSITPSGEAGSIGVISMYADQSKFYAELGIDITVMRVPYKKARFSGVEPMTDEMKAFSEERIGASYEKFKRAMATNRGIRIDQVEAKFGGGEMMGSTEAVEAGLVDRVATLDQVLSRLVSRRAPSGARVALARAQMGKHV